MKHRGYLLGKFGTPSALSFVDGLQMVEAILRVSGRVDGLSSITQKALALAIWTKKSPMSYAEATSIYEADLDEAIETIRADLDRLTDAKPILPHLRDDVDEERMIYGRD